MTLRLRIALVAAVAALSTLLGSTTNAQDLNINNGQSAGVEIDADGVLRSKFFRDSTRQVIRQRVAAAQASLNKDLQKPSKLRLISLNRLEKEMARRLAAGEQIADDMLNMAGLTRITYVFYYPESKDIIIGGPAEGYVKDLAGRTRGWRSGKPTLQLEDMIVAMRAFPPGEKSKTFISCSIDPTQTGLSRLQATVNRFARSLRRKPTSQQVRDLVGELRSALGLQEVTIKGIADTTHFANVMVEADYRMKLYGIGMEKPPKGVNITSYVSRVSSSAARGNQLQRWFFVPDYQCVRVAEDGLGMELVGDGVKLIGEDEYVSRDGKRTVTGRSNRASQAFTTSFTKKYGSLAKRSPVYAQLRNLIDMAVAAAFIQQQDWYGKADWKLGVMADEKKFAVEVHEPIRHAETACTAIWKGNVLMTPIGGGVTMQPKQALASSNLFEDEDGKVAEAHGKIDPAKLAPGRWWWDAE